MPEFDQTVFEEYRRLLHDCMTAAVDTIQQITKVENGTSDLLVLGLYASLVEYVNCALTLAGKKISAGDDVIFRSFLEGFVDLKNLLNVENYNLHLQLEHDMNWDRVLKAAADGNPFFETIALSADRVDRHAEHNENIHNLRRAGITKLTVKEKFKLAGLEQEYGSIYAFSSREAHNGLGALMRRHFVEDGKNYVIKLNHWDADRCSLRFDGYLSFLTDATYLVAKRFDCDADALFGPISERVVKLRKYVSDDLDGNCNGSR